jgi:hypothetical protein
MVGVECMFAWYWLAVLCERKRTPFVLIHAFTNGVGCFRQFDVAFILKG